MTKRLSRSFVQGPPDPKSPGQGSTAGLLDLNQRGLPARVWLLSSGPLSGQGLGGEAQCRHLLPSALGQGPPCLVLSLACPWHWHHAQPGPQLLPSQAPMPVALCHTLPARAHWQEGAYRLSVPR